MSEVNLAGYAHVRGCFELILRKTHTLVPDADTFLRISELTNAEKLLQVRKFCDGGLISEVMEIGQPKKKVGCS